MEARLLTSANELSGYSEEYLTSLLDTYVIIPIVVDLGAGSIEAIQPWDPTSGDPWELDSEALAWANAWIDANYANIDEPIIDIATAESHQPEMAASESSTRVKSAK